MNIFQGQDWIHHTISHSGAMIKKHRFALALVALVSGIGFIAKDYRGFYDPNGQRFKRLTIAEVNKILEKESIPVKGICSYYETPSKEFTLQCETGGSEPQIITKKIPTVNSSTYMCVDLALGADRRIHSNSGYCFRGHTHDGIIEYFDSSGEKMDLNFIPGKKYNLPIDVNQG